MMEVLKLMMRKSDLLGSSNTNQYNSDRLPLIHLDQLPKILICKWLERRQKVNAVLRVLHRALKNGVSMSGKIIIIVAHWSHSNHKIVSLTIALIPSHAKLIEGKRKCYLSEIQILFLSQSPSNLHWQKYGYDCCRPRSLFQRVFFPSDFQIYFCGSGSGVRINELKTSWVASMIWRTYTPVF